MPSRLHRMRAHLLRYPGSAVVAVGLLAYALAGIARPEANVATLARLYDWFGITREVSIAAFVVGAVVIVATNALWVKLVALALTVFVFAGVSIAYTLVSPMIALHAPLAHGMVALGMMAMIVVEQWVWVRQVQHDA